VARPAGLRQLDAAKLLAEVGPIDRFDSDAQLARHSGVARYHPAARAYLERKGKSRREAIRCLNANSHASSSTHSKQSPH
jgi:hypothetical protein